MRSWNTRPYVDVAITDEQNCPLGFTEDLIYDIWPGTQGHCDCLEIDREDQDLADYELNECNRARDSDTRDCIDRAGLAPIVQNRFNGVRYCSKPSEKRFSEMTRPVVDPANTGKYKCPAGTVPCNSAFFSQPNGE